MDFSPIHSYSPPEYAPDNTGYTYALSSSYSRAALDYELRNGLAPVYDSPRMSRRSLRLRAANGTSSALLFSSFSSSSSSSSSPSVASGSAAPVVMASQGGAGKTLDGSDSGKIKFAWGSARTAAVTNAARVRLDGGGGGSVTPARSPHRSPQRRPAINTSDGNPLDLLSSSVSYTVPGVASSCKVETASTSVRSWATALGSEASLANGAIPSVPSMPSAEEEAEEAALCGAQAVPTNGYGSASAARSEQAELRSSSYLSVHKRAARLLGERVGGLVQMAARAAMRAKRVVLRWLLLLLARLLWSDDVSRAAPEHEVAAYARGASFDKAAREEVTETTTTTVTTTTKTQRQRRRATPPIAKDGLDDRYMTLRSRALAWHGHGAQLERHGDAEEVATAAMTALEGTGGGSRVDASPRSAVTQRRERSSTQTLLRSGVEHYGYGGSSGTASLADFSDGEGCEVEKRSRNTGYAGTGMAAATWLSLASWASEWTSKWTSKWTEWAGCSSTKRVLSSPGRFVSALFWWLGTGWYQLVTLVSLLNVFLLTRNYRRHLLGLLLLLLLLLLPLLLFYGGWWCWAALSSLVRSAGPASAVPPVTPPPTYEAVPVPPPFEGTLDMTGPAGPPDDAAAAAAALLASRVKLLEQELGQLRASAAEQRKTTEKAMQLVLELRAQQEQQQQQAAATAVVSIETEDGVATAAERGYRLLDDNVKHLTKTLMAQKEEAERQRLRVVLLGRQVSVLAAGDRASEDERGKAAPQAAEEELLALVDERAGGSLAALLADVRLNRDGIAGLRTHVEQRDSEVKQLLSSIDVSVREMETMRIQLQDWRGNGSRGDKRADEEAGRRLVEVLARLEADVVRLEARIEALGGRVDADGAAARRCCGDAAGAAEHAIRSGVETSLLALLAGGDGAGGDGIDGAARAALLRLLSERFVRREELNRAVREHTDGATVGAAGVGAGMHGDVGGGVSEEHVQRIVGDALRLYSADRIGLVDYALESAGGSILSTRCTETYESKTAMVSFFGLPIWHLSQSPRVIIQPDVNPGNCWPFRGTYGYVVVQLSAVVRPTAFSLEHAPRALSPTGAVSSAPRDFAVYGLESEDQEEGLMLGRYSYNQDGEAIQTFPVQEETGGVTFRIVELRVFSNWGHPEYTCLYRFRVHGELARR